MNSKGAPQTLTETLRQTITDRRLTSYAVAKLADIDESAVQRFMKGERGLSLKSAEKIAAALKLALVPIDPPSPS